MRAVIDEIQQRGEPIDATKGANVELSGVLLELTNPRARISLTETRGKPLSCLGEMCWYLAGRKDLEFISYYIQAYEKFAEGNEIFGGYGPRLINWDGINQLTNVTELLRRRPSSRRAVVQLFDAGDLVEYHKDIPCTCTLQFMIRGQRLHMFTSMRSNDAFLGLPHDIFCFTMLQEIMARALNVELGTYKHAAGSLHLYDSNKGASRRFLDEGWQSTQDPMPSMPEGDPWPSIGELLKAESSIRGTGSCDGAILAGVDPYWADLIRLLQALRCKRVRDVETLRELRESMFSKIYYPFIDKTIRELC
jgi:thymidylate synthase